jgi:hypothetical protein
MYYPISIPKRHIPVETVWTFKPKQITLRLQEKTAQSDQMQALFSAAFFIFPTYSFLCPKKADAGIKFLIENS